MLRFFFLVLFTYYHKFKQERPLTGQKCNPIFFKVAISVLYNYKYYCNIKTCNYTQIPQISEKKTEPAKVLNVSKERIPTLLKAKRVYLIRIIERDLDFEKEIKAKVSYRKKIPSYC